MHTVRLSPDSELRFDGHKAAAARLISEIDPADRMLSGGNVRRYLQVGASALSAIKAGLAAADTPSSRVGSILDYACGYGRVLRWLQAEFAGADIVAMDTNEKALASVQRILNAETQLVRRDTWTPIGRTFDLIWVGSLFTHLPNQQSRRLLNHLALHLGTTGLLIFTMHGPHVVNRIRTGEKLYGLPTDQTIRLLTDYDRTGYGFGAHPHAADYGISVASRRNLEDIINDAGLSLVLYGERMWVRHQDVLVTRHAEAPIATEEL